MKGEDMKTVSLSATDLEEIDRIVAGSVALSGPSPEMMPE
jgi:hypothetical protein